jgi:hypothetical protein
MQSTESCSTDGPGPVSDPITVADPTKIKDANGKNRDGMVTSKLERWMARA